MWMLTGGLVRVEETRCVRARTRIVASHRAAAGVCGAVAVDASEGGGRGVGFCAGVYLAGLGGCGLRV